MNCTKILFFLFFVNLTFGQQKILIQDGHRAVVKTVAFSKDGKYLVSAAGNNKVKLWDFQSRKLLRTYYGPAEPITKIAISDDNRLLVGVGESSTIMIWDLQTAEMTFSQRFQEIPMIAQIAFDPATENLVFAAGEELFLWDIEKEKMRKHRSADSGVIVDMVIASDGQIVVSQGQNGNLKTWNLPKLSEGVALSHNHPGDIQFDLDQTGKRLAVWNEKAGKIALFTLSKKEWQLEKELSGPAIGNTQQRFITFSNDGTFLYLGSPGRVIKCNIAREELTGNLAIGYPDAYFLGISPKGSYFAQAGMVEQGDPKFSVKVWDLDNAKSLGVFWGVESWAGPGPESVQKYDGNNGLVSLANGTVIDLFRGRWLSNPGDIPLKSQDASTPQQVMGKYWSYVKNFEEGYDSIYNASWYPDSSKLFYVIHKEGISELREFNPATKIIELHQVFSLPVHKYSTNLTFAVLQQPETKRRLLYSIFENEEIDGIQLADCPTCKFELLSYPNHDTTYLLQYRKDWVQLSNLRNKKVVFTLNATDHRLKNFLYTASTALSEHSNGIIKFWDLGRLETVASLWLLKEPAFVFYTSEGYYYAGKGAEGALAFWDNGRILSMEQAANHYHRPELVLDKLNKNARTRTDSYRRTYQEQLSALDIPQNNLPADYQGPQLEITTKDIPKQTQYPSLQINIAAKDTQHALDRIEIVINGVPTHDQNGVVLENLQVGEIYENLTLELSSGRNNIELVAINEKDMESDLCKLVINYVGPSSKPDLYVIALGIDQYADPTKDIKYAAKDAEDVVTFFRDQSDRYGEIISEKIVGKTLSTEKIFALKEVLARSKVDDLVVLYVAGHCLADELGNYYLALHDSDFNNPGPNSISLDQFTSLLSDIAARKKLFLFDNYFLGGLKESELQQIQNRENQDGKIHFQKFGNINPSKAAELENSFGLMNTLYTDLRKSTGTSVLSSSSKAGFFIEGPSWQNGLFAYCFIKGLSSMQADLDGDERVFITELQKYLDGQLSSLTDDHQQLTFRTLNIANDFVLWESTTEATWSETISQRDQGEDPSSNPDRYDSDVHRQDTSVAMVEPSSEGSSPRFSRPSQSNSTRAKTRGMTEESMAYSQESPDLEVQAFLSLSNEDFDMAEKTALKKLYENATDNYARLQLAIAYLYQGKYGPAKLIWYKYKDQVMDTGESFSESLLSHINAMINVGIYHPDVKKFVNLVSGKQ